MTKNTVTLDAMPLRVELRTKFAHAKATRHAGESIWVRASKNGSSGYGEGCPRTYVAGDDMESSVAWVRREFIAGHPALGSFKDMRQWAKENESLIRRFPSAWCAVEMALLDLFSREQGISLELFLGLDSQKRETRYSAVLGDDYTWRYTYLADQYLIRDIHDFKLKIKGVPEKDGKRLDILRKLAAEYRIAPVRIRLDANNLWAGDTDTAVSYLKALDGPFFAVEEPVAARDHGANSRFSVETGLPVILDESLLTAEDLICYDSLPGDFIANIKISRVGGLLRALDLIRMLTERGWPIIIGCHVGETSLLTRAGLIVAAAAGELLTAHEGGFGDYLVAWEPVKPILRFGRQGRLSLNEPYYYKTSMGLHMIPPDNWDHGMGMEGRFPDKTLDADSRIETLAMQDGYRIHYRVWGETTGEDVLLVLHGGMSHSQWQAPLAEAVRALSPHLTVIAPDRRGCGCNENRGDLGTIDQVVSDVTDHVLFLKKHFRRVHLAGWCQGCQYATVAAALLPDAVDTLFFLAPGFFWNDRFRSVLNMSEKVLLKMIDTFTIKPDRDHACVPIPMEGNDFTQDEAFLDFIENDPLKTAMITLKSVNIMDEIQEMSWRAVFTVRQPILAIIADKDRIVDNAKVLQFLEGRFTPGSGNRVVHLDCGHAIQFEQPGAVAREITAFIAKKHRPVM
jgi:L-alanine-DL-glutamate epimerase-like enolase superfamily enzyme/pimeloyl-ACP methyl ester carboxylesterase